MFSDGEPPCTRHANEYEQSLQSRNGLDRFRGCTEARGKESNRADSSPNMTRHMFYMGFLFFSFFFLFLFVFYFFIFFYAKAAATKAADVIVSSVAPPPDLTYVLRGGFFFSFFFLFLFAFSFSFFIFNFNFFSILIFAM